MIAAIQKVLMIVGLVTVLMLWKMWFPSSWTWFWSTVLGAII